MSKFTDELDEVLDDIDMNPESDNRTLDKLQHIRYEMQPSPMYPLSVSDLRHAMWRYMQVMEDALNERIV